MIKSFLINLDMTKGVKMFPAIKIVRGDIGTNLFVVNLTDNGQPLPIAEGDTVELGFGKPDGNAGTQPCTILDAANGQVSALLIDQASTTAGTVLFEVIVYGTNQRKASVPFPVEVTVGVTDEHVIISTPAFSELNDALSRMSVAASAEEVRLISEDYRVGNEATRVLNETNRLSAEVTRVYNSNISMAAETARLESESTRVSNEASRVTAENTRNTNETSRVANEADRQNRFNQLSTAQQQAAEVLNARTSTNKAKTFATLNDRLEALEVDEITVVLDAQAGAIRESILSGFKTLSDLDYTYMSTNPNTIKTLTESIAYVNGYKTVIPAGTIITLNAPPVDIPRDDLVFLECWKAQAGNGPVTWNYRIRVVDGVDFNTYVLDGFTRDTNSASSGDFNSLVTAQGGNGLPVSYALDVEKVFTNIKQRMVYGATTWGGGSQALSDTGVYVCGRGNSSSKPNLLTFDGYVYAIPMFKIHRRPSCGYMETNEYLKISPLSTVLLASGKTSQARIAHTGLTGGVTTTISGKTLVNLLGDAGNCEDLSKWINGGATIDTSMKLFGSASLKVTNSASSNNFYKDIILDIAHKYFVSAYFYVSSYTSGSLGLSQYDYGTWNTFVANSIDTSKVNQWQRKSLLITGKSGTRLQPTSGGLATLTVNTDGIMIYDLTDIYGAGNEPSDIAQLERELPFVNGVGHAQPSALKVTCKNMLNKDKAISGYAVSTSDGTVNANGTLYVSNFITVKPSTAYTKTSSNSYALYDSSKQFISGSSGTYSITTPSNAKYIRINIPIANINTEQLEEGSTATTYEPYTESIANLPEECVDMKAIKTVKDTLDLSSGVLTKNISDWITLDGSLGWGGSNNYIGFKRINLSVFNTSLSPNSFPLVIKNTGLSLIQLGQTHLYSDYCSADGSANVFISFSNTDTGFVDSYTPSTNEIKAYFHGWKMCHSDGVSPYQVNEVNYNPSTWAEWTKSGGVVGNSTGLELTADGVSYPTISIPTALKVSTKYGILSNVVSNNLTGNLTFGGNSSPFTDAIFASSGTTGNIKLISTTLATITSNKIVFYIGNSNANGLKAKIKDIRVFELPVGSQIETDFTNLTPDALVAKYLFYGLNPKNWKKVTDGTGITATLPTGSYAGYTPYKMIYQLATPVVTNIKEKIQGRNYYNIGYNGIEVKQVSSKMDMPVAVPNLVSNGDFSNGTTGWTSGVSSLAVNNNILSVAGLGTNATNRTVQDLGYKPSINTKMYIKSKIQVNDSVCSNASMWLRDGGATQFAGCNALLPLANILYTISGITTISSSLANNLALYFDASYADNATQSGKVLQIQKPFVVDLTAMFGAGNEPDVAWCDKYLVFGTNFKMVSPTNTTALAISNDYGSRFESVKGNVGIIPASKYSANKTYKLHYQKEDGSYVPPEVVVTIPVNVNVSNLMSKYNSVVQSDLDSYDLNNDGIIDVYDATIASQGSIGAQLTKNATVTSFKLGKPLIPYKKHSDGSRLYFTITGAYSFTSITTSLTTTTTINSTDYNNIFVGDKFINSSSFAIQVISKNGNNNITVLNIGNASVGTLNSGYKLTITNRTDNLPSDIIADRDLYNLRHQVSLTGFNYQSLLDESFDKLLRNEL